MSRRASKFLNEQLVALNTCYGSHALFFQKILYMSRVILKTIDVNYSCFGTGEVNFKCVMRRSDWSDPIPPRQPLIQRKNAIKKDVLLENKVKKGGTLEN